MALVTLAEILTAYKVVHDSPIVRRTPLLRHAQTLLDIPIPFELLLKLESLQISGSFKIRGVVNQLASIPPDVKGCVTMSAGNYGRSLTFAATRTGNIPVTVCMSDTVPAERVSLLQSMGARVCQVPNNQLKAEVERIAAVEGLVFTHPFDDPLMIQGHASCALEILEDVADVDVIVVCCGGGGLLSGIAAAVKLSGSHARVIGVEPEGAPKMYQSRQEGKAVTLDKISTIAAGLAPPFAGQITFMHVQQFVDDLVLVSDDELRKAMRALYLAGLVVEPSGAAAVAAVMAGKVKDLDGRKVVCLVSGGNVGWNDLAKYLVDSEK